MNYLLPITTTPLLTINYCLYFTTICYMIRWLNAAAVASSPASSTSSSYLNQPCSKKSDCAVKNSHCKMLAPTCGVCTCLPGYVLHIPTDFSPIECRKAAYLDDSCSPLDGLNECTGDNVECSPALQRCVCKKGFKRGFRGTDCIPIVMEKAAGDLCYDNVQCFYAMDCVNFACTCSSGFKEAGDHQCAARGVGDQCELQNDCREAPHTRCLHGTCQCRQGYKAIQYAIMSSDPAIITPQTQLACVPDNNKNEEEQRDEGESCSLKHNAPHRIYCRLPFICTTCGNQSQCVDMAKIELATLQLDAAAISSSSALITINRPPNINILTMCLLAIFHYYSSYYYD